MDDDQELEGQLQLPDPEAAEQRRREELQEPMARIRERALARAREQELDPVVQLLSTGELKFASELTPAEEAAGVVVRDDLQVPPAGGYEREDLDVDEDGQPYPF